MAEYIIDKGVSPEVWADIEKLGKELGKLPSVGSSTKDEANLAKINAQVQLLIEKQKTQQALQAKNEASAQAAAQKTAELQEKALLKQQEVLSKITAAQQKLQIMRENNDAKNALAQKKYIDQLERQAQAAAKAVAASTPEARVSKSNTENILKLNAIAADANSTALQRMYAQMKILEIEMQAKFNPALQQQSQEFINLNAQHAKLQSEYQRTARATGVMGRTMNSAYGSTFQLTQVMRELPNFAISARIGFMSLSNNLPMLIDSFKILKQQIIDTEGAAGATKKTFAAFGKSLLSLNTIMIVASTLLVLFGDDIINWTMSLFESDKATKSYTKSITALLNAMRSGSGASTDATNAVIELGIAIDKYKKGTGDADSIVQKYNSTLGVHYGELKNINDVMAAYPSYAQEYIKYAIYVQAALMQVNKAAEALLKKQAAETELKLYDPKVVAQTGNAINELIRLGKIYRMDIDELVGDIAKGKTVTIGGFRQTGLAGMINQDVAQALIAKAAADKVFNDYTKSAEELYPGMYSKTNGNKPKTPEEVVREFNSAMSMLKIPELGNLFNVPKTQINAPNVVDENQGYNAMTASLNEQYQNGLLSYRQYFEKRVELQKEGAAKGLKVQEDVNQVTADIDAQHEQEMIDLKAEFAMKGVELLQTIWDGFYERYFQKLDEERKKVEDIENEKLQTTEDLESAGIITKEQAESDKARISAYYASIQDQIDKDQEEAEKKKFLLGQVAALAEVWINFAAASSSLENLLLGGALTPLYLGIASTSTALIAAQSIPYFAEGGIMDKNGMAMLGDGGKKELAISPSGKFFISNDTPTMYNLEKGTQILPDVNKLDLMSILALKQVMPNIGSDRGVLNELKNVTKAIQSQKSGNFYGMPLIKQLDNRSRYSSRNKSLMN